MQALPQGTCTNQYRESGDRSMTTNTDDILARLVDQNPYRLTELPLERGVYLLRDHTGKARYIGSTEGKTFRDRINSRHVTGSEENSHKFSRAYNTGRMWRAKRDDRADARTARRVRQAFIRRYCGAAVVPMPDLSATDLADLENRLIARAPASLQSWNGRRSIRPFDEPVNLLDALLNELDASAETRAALDRQAKLFAKYQADAPSALQRSLADEG